jgi:hypothetical protein
MAGESAGERMLHLDWIEHGGAPYARLSARASAAPDRTQPRPLAQTVQ